MKNKANTKTLVIFTAFLSLFTGKLKKKGVFKMVRRKRQPIVPEARAGLDKLKAKVMKEAGYNVSEQAPDDVKYEVAKDMGVQLEKGYNGQITSKDAGRVGGQIGGRMVKELIQQAKANLGKQVH
jgi:hypothetical protein